MVLKLYEVMKIKGIKFDFVIFVGVLLVCSYSGLVEEGYYYLNFMFKYYGVEFGNRYYVCMVDFFGRFGRLKEVEKFINGMFIKVDVLIWGILLVVCKVYGDVEFGRVVVKKVFDL